MISHNLSRELSQISDVITTEIEHINCDALEELERSGCSVQPHSSTFRLIQVCLLNFFSSS
jgi:phosphoribosylaminoimidazole carboxylase (NCAIR synthetase)